MCKSQKDFFSISAKLTKKALFDLNGIIHIFGPSCSGKSIVSQLLQYRFGPGWDIADRDGLINEGLRDLDIDRLIEEKIRASKKRILIDAQVPWREKRPGEYYFLLLPPLEVLLYRDARRTNRQKRSKEATYWTTFYVNETYDILSTMSKEKFDGRFDSSWLSVGEIASGVIEILTNNA